MSQAVFGALEVLPAWPVPLQDAYADTVLGTCKAAVWAADPSQSLGLLHAARLASLQLLAMIQAQGAGAPSAEHELSMTLSPNEFRAFQTALAAMGRTFRDLVKVGGAMVADSRGFGGRPAECFRRQQLVQWYYARAVLFSFRSGGKQFRRVDGR